MDDFSIRLTDEIYSCLTNLDVNITEIEKIIGKVKTNFFIVNKLRRTSFIDLIISELEPSLKELMEKVIRETYLTPATIFPKMNSISDEEAEANIDKIKGKEELLRSGLAKILRELGANPIPKRGKDSALEVADIELFRMKLKGTMSRLSVVVKGYESIRGSTKLNHEAIAHQIERAFQRGKPDHILLVSAMEPVDGLITSLEEYAASVGRPNLISFIPPLDFTKILLAYGFLK